MNQLLKSLVLNALLIASAVQIAIAWTGSIGRANPTCDQRRRRGAL